ncbi:helix-turn-helix domain-containing protein [Pseudomonas sp. BN417]|uniref:AraC family transcriptional regulator ligand-binding domain-containing protein n=1 Tax=Pseudomonas sp. BN417 TaxID=2567890 RepID=UPI002455B876|nr:AraC family transcriptional regulator ligand-binding domain-containing protein [Pseudomonas sp. BN417]MDH4553716.1 helix-turn-helix domain-containing protein [Pseudomonas sp. BN417]
MRETDRNTREVANRTTQRVHRGPLGQVLERYLDNHRRNGLADYSAVELEQLWLAAAEVDPAIGLHLFAQFTPQDWHVLAHTCLYCADVAGAIHCWQRYSRLASNMDNLQLIEDASGLGMQISIDAPPRLGQFMVEHYSVMAITQLRRGTNKHVLPALAQFAHARPSYHAEYRQWFGERVEFGCGHNRLYYAADTLRLPMQGRHAGMLELLCQELDRRMARHHQLSGWAGKVAASARQQLARGQVPSLESQAEALHQSPRTLRRRLEEQGLTFRQLLDQVRAELEQQLELQGETRSEIAFQLGYSDLAAYLHARKRWQAESP